MSVVRIVTVRATSTATDSMLTEFVVSSFRATTTTPTSSAAIGVDRRATGRATGVTGRSAAMSRSGSNATTSAVARRPSAPTTSTRSAPATTCAAVITTPSSIVVPVPSRVRGPHPWASIRTALAIASSSTMVRRGRIGAADRAVRRRTQSHRSSASHSREIGELAAHPDRVVDDESVAFVESAHSIVV